MYLLEVRLKIYKHPLPDTSPREDFSLAQTK